MNGEADLAAVGTLLADTARAAMLSELLGGEPLPAGELARRAGVSASGASNHLRRLLEGGLVSAELSGRRRMYSVASPAIAEALEGLGRISPQRSPVGLRGAERYRTIAEARTCYDHLAGRLGVLVTEAFVSRRLLLPRDRAYETTARGERWLADELAVDVAEARRSQRAFALQCVDLTERRPHLAGALGAAIADAFFAAGLVRRKRQSRALTVTGAGEAWLAANSIGF